MKISEFLWEVANKYLDYLPGNDNEYICDCIHTYAHDKDTMDKTLLFLKALGMGRGFTEFREFYIHYKIYNVYYSTIKAQCARYNFLMFASMYAEELEKSGELSDV